MDYCTFDFSEILNPHKKFRIGIGSKKTIVKYKFETSMEAIVLHSTERVLKN